MTTPKGSPKNPRQPVALGPTGQRVGERLKAVRNADPANKVSLRDLAGRLEDLGYPISADGLSKIETGKRRVDADDLVALAIALNVSPITLLFPVDVPRDEKVQLTKNYAAPAEAAWGWALVVAPLAPPPDDDGEAHWVLQQRSLPPWLQRITTQTPFMRRMLEEKRAELEWLSASFPNDVD